MTGPVWPTVMVTGHRPQHMAPSVHGWIRDELDRLATKLRDGHGMACGITGMALGADMWWADSLVRAGVPLWAHIPFPQQPDPWLKTNPDAVAEWKRLRALAVQERVYGNLDGLTGDTRNRRAVQLLHERNNGMLSGSGAVVAVWQPNKRDGGTYSALVKAHRDALPVILVNPDARTTTMPSRTRLAELLHPTAPEPLIPA